MSAAGTEVASRGREPLGSSPASLGPSGPVGRVGRAGPSAWRAFARDRVALGAGVYLLILVAAALFGPLFERYSYEQQNLSATFQLPNAEHLHGTDALGRDLLVRVIHGTRISLFIGLAAQAAEVLLGLALG